MLDRELLELAAKACGYDVFDDSLTSDLNVKKTGESYTFWSPLKNDGDAFRLAVKLEINLVHHHHGIGWVDAFRLGSVTIKELIGDDAAKATRLAIVKLAASIGKTK